MLSARLRWVLGDDLDERRGQVGVGADAVHGHPGPAHAGGQAGVALLDTRAEPGAQQRVAGIDDELLPGLDVFDDDQADVGQLVIGDVEHAQRDDLVTRHQAQQRPPPVAGADEVGDDHDQGAAPGELGQPRRASPRGRSCYRRLRPNGAVAVLASSAPMRSACLRPVPGGTIRTAAVLSSAVS